jgi:fumarate reductase subunit D
MPAPPECVGVVNWGLIISGGMGVANIAAVIVLIRLVIAPVVVNVRAISKSVETIERMKQDHHDRIIAIETTHRIKGCDFPHGARYRDGADKSVV